MRGRCSGLRDSTDSVLVTLHVELMLTKHGVFLDKMQGFDQHQPDTEPNTNRRTAGFLRQKAGQHLVGQQHKGLMAERRAEQIVETDLFAQPQDLVTDLVGCPV